MGGPHLSIGYAERKFSGGYGPITWCLFHFLYFSSVGITHFATASVVRVVMDFLINQRASELFILIFALFC